MKTTVRTVGQVSVVDLSGKITIGEGDVVLRDKVLELLDGGHSKILLSLEKVSYMDSAGIGELVACFKKAREKGGTVKLLEAVREGRGSLAADEAVGGVRDFRRREAGRRVVLITSFGRGPFPEETAPAHRPGSTPRAA